MAKSNSIADTHFEIPDTLRSTNGVGKTAVLLQEPQVATYYGGRQLDLQTA